ncbi:hypothetical protein Sango_2090800, partial [Sesamum angolense]
MLLKEEDSAKGFMVNLACVLGQTHQFASCQLKLIVALSLFPVPVLLICSQHILEKVEEHYSGKHISEIDLPLIKAASFDPADQDYRFINSQNFLSMFEDDKALLLQVISSGSNRCAQFSTTWKKIGLPVVLAFPPGCKSSSCLTRYNGELSVDAITDWVATSILNLPRIPYYFKESVVHNFLAKGIDHHEKHVIECASMGPGIWNFKPILGTPTSFLIVEPKPDEPSPSSVKQSLDAGKQNSKSRSSHSWQEGRCKLSVETSFFAGLLALSGFNRPLKTIRHMPRLPSLYGKKTNLLSGGILLPQLRNVTSMELGCDVHGYSRAGSDTKI